MPDERNAVESRGEGDREHVASAQAGRGGVQDVRERKGGGKGEAPWCERCVGMTIFTKEMKERG
jgi:hypothetical protein